MSNIANYLYQSISFPPDVFDQQLLKQYLSNQCSKISTEQLTKWTSTLKSIQEKELNLEALLKQLNPWRKGPFQINDIFINSEWQCQLKWGRFLHSNIDLNNKKILDIGCGSGYYLFRIGKEHSPQIVIGIDPTILFLIQFLSIQHFYQQPNISFIPIGFQEIPKFKILFDVIFCMGILYHHKDPQSILKTIYSKLSANGKVILETLVIDSSQHEILIPKKKYANMRNVYEIPSIPMLMSQLKDAGFSQISVIDVTKTTPNEQRSTHWSSRNSLINFLDPSDHSKTIEGYPAPIRAMISATKGH